MPSDVREMLCATHGVTSEAAANPNPSNPAPRKKRGGGHDSGAGKTLEKARNVEGMRLALANVILPQNSVYVPVPTPAIPTTQPLIERVNPENQRFVASPGRARTI